MGTMNDENKTRPVLNSRFFNSKYEQADLKNQRLNISQKYLGVDSQTDHANTPTFDVVEIIKKVETDTILPVPKFNYLHSSIKPDETAKKWGFSLDPKIAELTITLNCLGLYTASACEGHLDRGEPYPEISFWNEEFFKVLGYLKEWCSPLKQNVMIRSSQTITDEVEGQMFEIFFYGTSLEESQKYSNEFLEFLRARAM